MVRVKPWEEVRKAVGNTPEFAAAYEEERQALADELAAHKTYRALAYRDESGAWCGRVDELHANTDAGSLRELQANLADAIGASFGAEGPFTIEVYVHLEDIGAAVAEPGLVS